MNTRDDERLRAIDRAILSGRSSFEIAKQFGIRDTSVRKMRRLLRERGNTIAIEGMSSNVNRNKKDRR